MAGLDFSGGDLVVLLRATALGAGLEPDALALLAEGSRRAAVRAGETIFRYGDPAGAAHVLLAGRVRVVATDRIGDETVLGYLEPGEVFGAVSVFESGRRSTTAVAADDCEMLVIEGEALCRAVGASRQLAFTLLTGFGRQMGRAMNLRRGERPAARVAVIRGRGTASFVNALADGIAGYGQTVLRDPARAGGPGGDPAGGPVSGGGETLPRGHRLLLEWVSDDLTAPPASLLAACDRVVWVVPAGARRAADPAVRAAVATHAGLAEKARVVWLLDPGEMVYPTETPAVGVRDFKVPAPGDGRPAAAHRRAVGRVVRDLLGVRRGLALSGGGAKGMAHLGVLRALDRAGIDFDLLSGSSGGALAGVPYAAGYDPDYCVASFHRALATPWHFRQLPKGASLYLVWCFRTGRFDAMLRPFLHHWRLDQLPVPFAAVAVDLVAGREVVRDSGDAVRAVLESINVPGISRPIVRGDQALTDGGVLNNLPSDVLVARGAGFVVAVDVTRRMRAEFAGLAPGHPAAARPGSAETMFRVLEVLAWATNDRCVRTADLVIAPDTAAFNFADFEKTHALADAGERAAEEALPRLRAALGTFERRVLEE